ncbi:MAG TPA: tRNA preQ1(34) S-adenosylmethionine ribosyltransferase-isomerase QueA [Candidatus Methylomirabilis sp.]|nr:tRNA preQ1(34) S-adenosylmethionine ribosyltransferase-isomerase QueA [Candidatus Methylomirabilis sp.]
MRKSDFHYSLPEELIAQFPASPRSASRLLHLDDASGALHDLQFADLPSLLRVGDLLVFNDTRVIPARVHGRKDSGGRIEVLIERIRDAHRVLAQVRASKPPKPGQKLELEGNVTAEVRGREGEFYELAFDGEAPVAEVLERIGHVPLPPYIARPDETSDRERYQTVYARHRGAVAAPTAGLHFDQTMLAALDARGVQRTFVTLHVGAGTFQPVRVDDIREHKMHAESLSVSPATCDRIKTAQQEGRRVVAVGTTVVRALETAARDGIIAPYEGETDIFIYPGYRFRVVDALLTNFHLPESTLLMLICAFGGTAHVLNAYRHAVENKYRFYSYGDAMFVTRTGEAR